MPFVSKRIKNTDIPRLVGQKTPTFLDLLANFTQLSNNRPPRKEPSKAADQPRITRKIPPKAAAEP
jgi:hypothetical protein